MIVYIPERIIPKQALNILANELLEYSTVSNYKNIDSEEVPSFIVKDILEKYAGVGVHILDGKVYGEK